MALVTGRLSDFGLNSLYTRQAVVSFAASNAGVKGIRLLASTPIRAEIASNGAFTVDLEPTEAVIPDCWYEVTIEHLGEGGEFTHFDHLNVRVRVPASGGNIGDMVDYTPPPGRIVYGYGPPPASLSGVLYVDISGVNPVLYAPSDGGI